MLSHMFSAHGRFCASHPWEVIVATLTVTICLMSVNEDSSSIGLSEARVTNITRFCSWQQNCLGPEEHNAVDIIFMTIIRCAALLYCYYQFRTLHRMGSKYILGIAGLFAVFSSFIFCSTVINFLQGHLTDLRDALFFFLLLTDLSKASVLAQFALSSFSQREVEENIAQGMALLGPRLTLDTAVETLVIGIGTLSGVKRLEMLCTYACMSAAVNYMVFMTFYPACLSLILELSESRERKRASEGMKSLVHNLQVEEEQKSNPVVQRVKVIMAAGLMLVHAHSRWPILTGRDERLEEPSFGSGEMKFDANATQEMEMQGFVMRWLTGSADRIVILILLFALALKYIYLEDKEPLAEHLKRSGAAHQATRMVKNSQFPRVSSCASDMSSHSRRSSIVRSASFTIGGDWSDDAQVEDKEVQTDETVIGDSADREVSPKIVHESRSLEQCVEIYRSEGDGGSLTDDEIVQLVGSKHIAQYQLEKAVCDPERGVGIRRQIIGKAGKFLDSLSNLPYRNYDYSLVMGACCESVIGYVPVPVGVAGPLLLDGKFYHIPMATTEGCLVASTNRGCRALSANGVRSKVVADGMTRGPVVRFPTAMLASDAKAWLQKKENYEEIKTSFDSTSRFARLQRLSVQMGGRYLFIRFVSLTGDAMGMNMLSKGTEIALKRLQEVFPEMDIMSLSGNYCTDKKPNAVNWIEGRGKSVVCEAIVPAKIVQSILKTDVQKLVELNVSKNLMGSAIAGSIGGNNAQAANIVTAIYIATGQDPAQNVSSSNCLTVIEPHGENGQDLSISCTMPSLELGTVGGGTILPAQAACLDMLGVKGPHPEIPGENACTLAKIICGAVLAGELSLMSALSAGHLVRSHLQHNRSSQNVGTQPLEPPSRKISHLLQVPPEC